MQDDENYRAKVNERHRQVIELHLRIVEREMAELETFVLSNGEEGILYRVRNPLSEQVRKELLAQIGKVRKGIRELKELYNLAVEERDVVPRIRALLSHDWIVLCETVSKQLRGFGDPDPELAKVLDPSVEKLVDVVQEMQAILRSNDLSKE